MTSIILDYATIAIAAIVAVILLPYSLSSLQGLEGIIFGGLCAAALGFFLSDTFDRFMERAKRAMNRS